MFKWSWRLYQFHATKIKLVYFLVTALTLKVQSSKIISPIQSRIILPLHQLLKSRERYYWIDRFHLTHVNPWNHNARVIKKPFNPFHHSANLASL